MVARACPLTPETCQSRRTSVSRMSYLCIIVNGLLSNHMFVYLHLHIHIPSSQYQSKTAGYEARHNHQQYIQYNNTEIHNNITTHRNTGQ
jgi:hypothetical protein